MAADLSHQECLQQLGECPLQGGVLPYLKTPLWWKEPAGRQGLPLPHVTAGRLWVSLRRPSRGQASDHIRRAFSGPELLEEGSFLSP